MPPIARLFFEILLELFYQLNMNIEYVSHACLLIDTGDLKVATDPWFGAAYCDQWHVFPKPVNKDHLQNVDVILISHGHEDHLHEETLKTLPKSARVFYPYHFFGGAKEFIESMGFASVKEAVTYKRYKLSDKTAVTYIINSHDSLMVIEADGKVIVNVNDALHSYPQKVIDYYLNEITTKFPKIDVLFCGFGGASYFPNAMHLDGKDDMAVGLVREQLFAHNFCRVTEALKPQIAVPFAADFALLADDQRWINDCRFPRQKMRNYYQKHFASADYEPQICDMYSGDKLEFENGKFGLKAVSPYRAEMRDGGKLEHLIDEQYSAEVAELKSQTFVDEAHAAVLADAVRENVQHRSALYKPEKLEKVRFCLEVTDVRENRFYNIRFENSKAVVSRTEECEPDSLLTMRLSSKILEYSIASDWGADVISIGYGAEISITSRKAATVDLESVCMNLLACYPTALGTLKKAPFRTFEFMVTNPPRYTKSIKKLKKHNFGSENYDRKVWLLKTPEEIRAIYNLPELDQEFLPQAGVQT